MRYMKLAVLLYPAVLFGCTEKSPLELLDSPPPELLAKVEPYIQASIDFAHENEKNAFENGVELTAEEKEIASKLGVVNVDKVRVLYVDKFPYPKDKNLVVLARTYGFNSPQAGGFTFGYGIYIRHGFERLLSHELIHVRQYEKMGIEGYLNRYMLELAVMGYRKAPLEVEAYKGAGSY